MNREKVTFLMGLFVLLMNTGLIR